jgi:hypothetical protein
MRASRCAFSIRSRATSRPRCRSGYSVGEDNDGGLLGHVDEMVIIVGANGVADSDQVLLLCHPKSECIADVNTSVAHPSFCKDLAFGDGRVIQRSNPQCLGSSTRTGHAVCLRPKSGSGDSGIPYSYRRIWLGQSRHPLAGDISYRPGQNRNCSGKTRRSKGMNNSARLSFPCLFAS